MDTLRHEMKQYYTQLRHDRIESNTEYQCRRMELWNAMDALDAASPSTPACLLKAKLHEEIAARFEPVLFKHSPFFFEMGVRFAENWGNPAMQNHASWMIQKRNQRHLETEEWRGVCALSCGNPESPWKVWNIWNVFDVDHHCLGYTKLLRFGVDGVLAEIRERRKTVGAGAHADFLESAERSCVALLAVANRFAAKAEELALTESDPDVLENLKLIASAARQVPARPPRTFHEGLASLLFLREATASLENIGISVLGHADRLLGGLLRRDLLEGVITEEEAKDMIARWMLHTDIKFHVDDSIWPETSTCVELGGCDEDGKPIFNDVTRLFIEAHQENKLVNPKLNCRYGASSPDTYIKLLARHAAGGHNAFAFLNDDVLIPACVKAGKTEREARLYVNGGCQETIVEGVEHSAGAYYYFNMARLLDFYIQPETVEAEGAAAEVIPKAVGEVPTFEAFYSGFTSALAKAIGQGAEWLRQAGQGWSDTHPCPLFSTSLDGCVTSAKDYTAGGAKYNPSALALVGFGTVVDSLRAIEQAVFKDEFISMAELTAASAANWQGHEPLRKHMESLPKFGHGDTGADALAARFAHDIADFCRPMRNERGGPFLPSFFVYYFFQRMGKDVRATPDGRRDGEMLSQGVSPGRVRPAENLTDVMRAVGGIDLRDFPGNAVLDIQLPLLPDSAGCSDKLSAAMRTFSSLGGATLQTNTVSLDALRDAKTHPERHCDLVVRISGLSAKFVCLQPEVQDEIISRAMPR